MSKAKKFFFSKKFHARWCIYEFCGIKLKLKTNYTHIDTLNLMMDKNYGIGNRIFAIVNALKFYTPKHINIYWAKEGWVSESMQSLFSLDNDLNITEFNSIEKMSLKNSKTERTIEFPQASLITKDKIERCLSKNNIDQNTINNYKKLFNKIKPSKKVLEIIEKMHLPNNYIALQIRNAEDWDDYGRNENLDSFIKQIKSYPENSVFYLSAMNEKTSSYIKNNVPHTIIELPNKNYNSMYDAVADLYILSNAKEGIYSYGSTFGELAWWLSDKEQKYKIVGSNKNWKTPKKNKTIPIFMIILNKVANW